MRNSNLVKICYFYSHGLNAAVTEVDFVKVFVAGVDVVTVVVASSVDVVKVVVASVDVVKVGLVVAGVDVVKVVVANVDVVMVGLVLVVAVADVVKANKVVGVNEINVGTLIADVIRVLSLLLLGLEEVEILSIRSMMVVACINSVGDVFCVPRVDDVLTKVLLFVLNKTTISCSV